MGDTAYLVLNGATDANLLSSRLKGKTDIYCVDGGYLKLKAAGLEAEAIIGDLDSLKDTGIPFYALPKVISRPDQNHTDFEKALNYLMYQYRQVDIYGASGGSPDHMLNNLSSAREFRDMVKLRFYDSGMCYFFLQPETTLHGVKGKTISVIPFASVSGVQYEGLEYEANNATFRLGEHTGARNRALEDTVKITFKGGCAIAFVGDCPADCLKQE